MKQLSFLSFFLIAVLFLPCGNCVEAHAAFTATRITTGHSDDKPQLDAALANVPDAIRIYSQNNQLSSYCSRLPSWDARHNVQLYGERYFLISQYGICKRTNALSLYTGTTLPIYLFNRVLLV